MKESDRLGRTVVHRCVKQEVDDSILPSSFLWLSFKYHRISYYKRVRLTAIGTWECDADVITGRKDGEREDCDIINFVFPLSSDMWFPYDYDKPYEEY